MVPSSFSSVRPALFLLVLVFASVVVKAERHRVFIGTYTSGDSISKGVYTCEFDSESGKLTEPKLAAELINPSFLAVHPGGKFLYAVNEVSEVIEEPTPEPANEVIEEAESAAAEEAPAEEAEVVVSEEAPVEEPILAEPAAEKEA